MYGIQPTVDPAAGVKTTVGKGNVDLKATRAIGKNIARQ
jgi:hypothetical protein